MPFTPLETFFGGILLHLSTSSLLSDTGRVLGISGVVDGAVFAPTRWRWAIICGLLAGPAVGAVTGLNAYFPGDGLGSLAVVSVLRLVLAGVLVGFGSRLGSGCTSGHMLCGVSRLSPRSIVATGTFFTTAVITANMASNPFVYIEIAPKTTAAAPLILTMPTIVATVGLSTAALRRYIDAHVSLRLAPYFLSGLVFSLGLSISGMTDGQKVWGFLRLFHPRDFDPSLAMVVLGGVLPNAVHYAWLSKLGELKPRYSWESWRVPTRRDIDWKLVGGAATFGIGWGLVGICPGPIIVSLGDALLRGTGMSHVVPFIASMVSGMALCHGFSL